MTEDEITFGILNWVYCLQHMRPHLTGWCSVSNEDKIGLGIVGDGTDKAKQARDKCRRIGLRIYGDKERQQ